MIRILLIVLALVISAVGYAEATHQPLSADKAFLFSSQLDPSENQIILQWKIAPGYYLYRDKLKIAVTVDSPVKIGSIVLPHAKTKKYTGLLKIAVPLQNPDAKNLRLVVYYQGCSREGFCYAPVTEYLSIDTDQDIATRLLNTQHFFWIVIGFIGLGLLLAFTPCILPMVPILSGIIVGHGKQLNTVKAFCLSLAYVMGMAITYMAAGIIVALVGSNIQASLQKPWVIMLFSGLFVLLGLSLLGLFELHMPRRWQKQIGNWSHHQKSGNYISVFCMGSLSTLIVSPCVSAPLVGVLAYIGQTGNVVLGALALFSLGIGMGIPLLLIGMSAGKLLPRTGPWMGVIKKLFGVIMLGFAIWMMARVIPPTIMEGWLPELSVPAKSSAFISVKNNSELDRQLILAKKANKFVVLDFYADWCVSCKIMDHQIFNQPDVQNKLKNIVMLRVDVTENNTSDKELLKRFTVIAPPTILFFHKDKLMAHRVVGEINKKEFFARLQKVGVLR